MSISARSTRRTRTLLGRLTLAAALIVGAGAVGAVGAPSSSAAVADSGHSASVTAVSALPSAEQLRSSHEAARARNSKIALRDWMRANVSSRRTPRSGTHPGGRVDSQARADAMRGKTVTGRVEIGGSGTYVFDQVTFRNRGKIEILDNVTANITMRDVLIDQADQSEFAAPFQMKGRGTLTVDRVEIRGGTDAYQQFRGSIRGRYLYIHDARPFTAPFEGNRSHFDGMQIMGGNVDIYGAYIDYTAAPASGQAFYVGHDVADTGTIRLINSFVDGGGNALTMQPRGTRSAPRWPSVVEFDGLLGAEGFKRSTYASLYNPDGLPWDKGLVTKERVQFSPCGETFRLDNGITKPEIC